MKKKYLIFITILTILSIAMLSVAVLTNMHKSKYFNTNDFIDNSNKWTITTNTKWLTMLNDGGSHTNIYYLVNFDNDTVTKCEDKYIGFEGYKYKGKILNIKSLNGVEKENLNKLLKSVFENNRIKDKKSDYNFYLISSFDSEDIKLYDSNLINEINKLLE